MDHFTSNSGTETIPRVFELFTSFDLRTRSSREFRLYVLLSNVLYVTTWRAPIT